jgi:hypothetical protein
MDEINSKNINEAALNKAKQTLSKMEGALTMINDPDLFDSLLSRVKWFKIKEMLDMFNPTSLNYAHQQFYQLSISVLPLFVFPEVFL